MLAATGRRLPSVLYSRVIHAIAVILTRDTSFDHPKITYSFSGTILLCPAWKSLLRISSIRKFKICVKIAFPQSTGINIDQ
jgi:hypothetical protein